MENEGTGLADRSRVERLLGGPGRRGQHTRGTAGGIILRRHHLAGRAPRSDAERPAVTAKLVATQGTFGIS
jgi:hypothetical protein